MRFIGLVLFSLLSLIVNGQEQLIVHFDFDRYELTLETRNSLDSFLQARQSKITGHSLKITGHCDAIGSLGYNDQLSSKRIQSVKAYLLEKGIALSSILEEKALGERKPLNDNSTEVDRFLNRRVEIEFIPFTLKQKIADTAVIAGTNLSLRNINFYGGQHRFLLSSAKPLMELLEAMESFPNLVIRIEGHICCQQGTDDGLDIETGNYDLSEARAKAVLDYLVTNGIDRNRLDYKGFGHSAPIYAYPEKTEEERTENRRVEIKIIRK